MSGGAPAGDGAEPWLVLSAPPRELAVGHHNGPGLRFIFWVKGCSLRCTRNCLNPHLLRPEGGHRVRAPEMARALLELSRDYPAAEGVTVLGGEPFDQAAALALCLAPVRRAGLSVMVYSGHTLEQLVERGGEARLLLDEIDVLVDGPFVDALFDERLIWRGSTNQRVLPLSDRYSEADLTRAMAAQGRGIAVSRAQTGGLVVSGAQNVNWGRSLRRLARRPGAMP